MKNNRITKLAAASTIFALGWMVFLAIAENLIGERIGLAATLAYIPQHPLGVPVVFALIFSLIARKPRLIFANITFSVIFLFVFMGFHAGFGSSTGASTLRVMTWNVHTYRSNPAHVMSVIDANSPDVLFLQEVDRGSTVLNILRSRGWNVESAADVAVASKNPISSPKAHSLLPGATRRALLARVKTKDGWLNLVCVHFATNRKANSKRHIIRYMRGSASARTMQIDSLLSIADDSRTVIAGDFNLPPRGPAYRKICGRFNSSAAAETGFGYTFPSRFPLLRIDHVFTTHDLRTVSSRVIRTRASDHLPIVAEIEVGRELSLR